MKSLVVPNYLCPDVSALVKVASQDDVFKQSNHDSDILYVKLHKTQNGVPVYDERGNPVGDKSMHKYEEIRHELRSGKHMVFMSVDSFRNSAVFAEGQVKVQEVVFMHHMEHQGVSKYFFFGEEPKGDVVRGTKSRPACTVKAYVKEIGVHAVLIFPHTTLEEAREFADEFNKARKKQRVYVSGMVMPVIVTVKEKGMSSMKVVQNYVLVNEWWAKTDRYEDIGKIIDKITSINDVTFFRDLVTGEPLYPEYVRKMMWYSTAYVKMGDPVFNLILSGVPGVAKSTALGIHAALFSVESKTPIGSGGTKKGLIPSFSGDVPLDGALVSEPWFAPVDEFFTLSTSEGIALGVEKIANAHRQYIRDLLPVITRAKLRYPSAKDNNYEVVMESSLMATDNLIPKTREALKALVEEDPATLRRFCLVWLGPEVKSRVRRSPGANVDENIAFLSKYWLRTYGFPLSEMKRFGEWFRSVAADVQVDGLRCMEMQNDAIGELLMQIRGAMLDKEVIDEFCGSVDFSVHIIAMVRCEAVMRAVYESKKSSFSVWSGGVCGICLQGEKIGFSAGGIPTNITVSEQDYVSARELFKKVMKDSFFLFDVSALVHESGIRRTA